MKGLTFAQVLGLILLGLMIYCGWLFSLLGVALAIAVPGLGLWLAWYLNVDSDRLLKTKNRFFSIFENETQLRHLAYHDALTGVSNRHQLELQMKTIITAAQRSERGFALVILDLDRFKNINDTIGHDAGDRLLQVVGKRLKNAVRSTDIIARVGGDEFVIVLNEVNKVNIVIQIVQKIMSHLQQLMVIKDKELFITTSLGISLYPYDGRNLQTLMQNADLALYRAKELGRNNYQFCTQEMTARAQVRTSRQNALAQGLDKKEFVLYYQPKLDLQMQTISGVEALLRWNNVNHHHIKVNEIIALAEETGLIFPLSDWILSTACAQVMAWHSQGFSELTLSVNLSARQFKQANFVDTIMKVISAIQFPAKYLELEITEKLIMQDPEYILNSLIALKNNDIKIAIDDFGTGYSSLDYLQRFAIDKIKIDKAFIQKIPGDTATTSLVAAIIAMAKKMEINIAAEGVETQEQLEFLSKERCNEIQGYCVSRPVDVEEMTKFLTARSTRNAQVNH